MRNNSRLEIGPVIRFRSKCLVGALLLLIVPAVWAWAQKSSPEPAKEKLTPEQQQALIDLIRSLENLQATSLSAEALTRWINAERERIGAELKGTEAQLKQLYGELQGTEQKKKALEGRLRALRAGVEFLNSLPSATKLKPARALPEAGATPTAAKTSNSPGTSLFAQHIRPVLEANCLKCHGGGPKKFSSFDLSTRRLLLRGGDRGPAVVPADTKASLLYKLITHEQEPHMPFGAEKLPDEVIARIAEWIDASAPYDESLVVPESGKQVAKELPQSDHWAFERPKRPPVPVVKNPKWVRNPIDAFVAAAHEKHGLNPLPTADKFVLLRRVYLDLIGLPPTPEELKAFLDDDSSDAYEKLVDKLLASPHYGERWGRHWMDIWRYSDWYGRVNEVRNSQPHIWHWRDWIIDSLNQDKGYDQMILEMLAGDEIAPADPKVLRATGYLARDWYRFNRNVWLQNTVNYAAMGFLGITLKCARCHDHKYDPFSQEEYYRFRAFFEPYDVRTDRIPGQPDTDKNGLPRVYDAEPREPTKEAPFLPGIFAKTFLFIRGDERSPDTEHPLSPSVPKVLGGQEIEIQPVNLTVESYYPALRSFVHRDLLAQAKEEIKEAEASLAKAQETLAEARQRAASVSSNSPSDFAAAQVSAEEHFEKEIRPIFEKHCFSCHSFNSAKSGLVLETLETILVGGDKDGPVVIRRNSAGSPLIQHLRGEKKPRMPLNGLPLPEEEIARIGQWIDDLPEEEPQVVLGKAEAAVALAEKGLVSARAYLPALEARIAADEAKYGESPDPNAEALAKAARKAERQFQILKGEEKLLRAQQKLTEALLAPAPKDEKAEKVREKKIGAARKELDAAQASLAKATENYTPLGTLYPKTSTGRRTALARWIASEKNPLTARVAMNHIWLRHFGRALVPTVSNFGLNGKAPTHAELLDWLAVEFMEKNWSMKAMHRLIITSNTYRMQSSTNQPDHPNVSIDPENQYLWRMNARRMEAENVRDSLLHVARQLDTTMGGPDIDESEGETSRRRSIYFRHTPDERMEFLTLFDGADPNECYERGESVVPQQALAMSNSGLSLTMARLVAHRLSQQIGRRAKPAAFVRAAFEELLGRPSKTEELAECEKFLQEQRKLFREPKKLNPFRGGLKAEVPPADEPHLRGRENLVHVLLNHNEFVTIR